MPFDTWLAFAAASIIVLVIPGPTILLVVSYALGHGRRSALASVAGVGLGDLTAMTISMAGMGAILATSATLFTAVKIAGALYLVWLGIKLWRSPVSDAAIPADRQAVAPGRMAFHAFAVTALNPKGIVFFVAFVPQFIDPALPFLSQVVVLEATFVTLAMINVLIYALLASAARNTIRKPSVQRAVNRTGGSLLIGAGAFTAAMQRAN